MFNYVLTEKYTFFSSKVLGITKTLELKKMYFLFHIKAYYDYFTCTAFLIYVDSNGLYN